MNLPLRPAFRVLPWLMLGAAAWHAQAADTGASAPAPAKEIVERADGKPVGSPAPAATRPNTARSGLAPSSPARARQPEAPAEAASGVSMTELRDLIDQKIAEVRAKQETAPVVRVNNNTPAARKAVVKKKVAPVVAAAASVAAAPVMPVDPLEQPWTYNGVQGPDRWAQLRPEYATCGSGKRQSPIDIRDGIKVTLDPIQFDYRTTPFKVLDTGRTVQARLEGGNSITINGRRYDLQRIEFHRPSEERINGRQFEMSAHLVHRDAEGRTAVVAVLMDQSEQGEGHPMVQLVWNSLPLEKYIDQASSVPIDMARMLPEQKQYLTYMGSLTAPPCTEGVLWMVMKQPIALSREQIGVFSRLYPMNARPVQNTSGRLIKDGQ
ncbi:MAG: carbonic anhydrase family protein [Aquabacterium sp.]|uniref:carbonic anhydrase n=1 Tax=Aquabacterium sp. TaxID=1872578 RepID=UPI003BAFE2DC